MNRLLRSLLALLVIAGPAMAQTSASDRPRAREAGVVVGIFEPGALNAITDVAGVRVGHATVIEGDSVRTGVTAILPHGGSVFDEKVPAAIHRGNGFGKLVGVTQVRELGEIETPVLLTCTLCVWKAADAMVDWLIAQPGMENVRSINPIVGETNDGYLNDIRERPIRPEHVVRALESASDGPVEEGAVGAGTGTTALGWKGGIGTSSRRLPASLGGHTVGVLVQSNYGGVLTINGAPVGRELGRYAFRRAVEESPAESSGTGRASGTIDANADAAGDAWGRSADGSIMVVVATDAPLDARNLDRLAKRAMAGIARTGSSLTNGSGDYVIAFSTAESVRRRGSDGPRAIENLPNDRISPLFQATAEATEEAIYNSLFKATAVAGHRGAMEALPIGETLDILREYDALNWDRTLPPQR